MNELEKIIYQEILDNGPMRIDHFLNYALAHPEYGYYMKRDPFGREGDFITAPEISQCFGETLAFYFLDRWQQMGKPEIQLYEMGAGRGSLMQDFLRTTEKLMPEFLSINKISIVDTSPHLCDLQKAKLQNYNISWQDHFQPKDGIPLFFIANELIDALPIRQFQKQNGKWFERMIRIEDDALAFTLQDNTDIQVPEEYAVNDFYESNKIAEVLVSQIDRFIQKNGGIALFIDYGYVQSHGYKDTLQALSHHEFAHPLRHIGEQDLTTHVNFHRLQNLIQNPCTIVDQGVFLESLGIRLRAQQLIDITPNHLQKQNIETAINRLIAPDQMGSLFKALILSRSP